MICYLDRSFCASKTEAHTCGREITEEQVKRADELGLPIAYSFYCGGEFDPELK